jgi:hypothetical protein
MPTSFRYEPTGLVALMTTELNSLAASQAALQNSGTNPFYDNSAVGNQFFWADFEMVVTFGVAPTNGQTLDLYLIPAPDGTNFSDGTSGASPVTVALHYAGSFPMRAVATAQRVTLRGVPLSPVLFKAQLYNGTGQAMAASGNTVKMLPYRQQGI